MQNNRNNEKTFYSTLQSDFETMMNLKTDFGNLLNQFQTLFEKNLKMKDDLLMVCANFDYLLECFWSFKRAMRKLIKQSNQLN